LLGFGALLQGRDDWCCGKGEKIGPYHTTFIHPSIFHPWFSCPKTNDADDADDLGEMAIDKI
jgi:hypothetical protein